jgi:hypothetical protein
MEMYVRVRRLRAAALIGDCRKQTLFLSRNRQMIPMIHWCDFPFLTHHHHRFERADKLQQLWTRWKRESAFAFLFFNCIIFAACPGPMIAPATIALSLQLHVPVKKVAELSGYQLLIVGALGYPRPPPR